MKHNHPIHTNTLLIYLSLLFAVAYTLTLPNCQTNEFYKMLPLTPNQAYYLDMANIFSGYNLRFNVSADTDLEKYLKLSSKIGLQKQQYPDVPIQGLKSLHISKSGNSWGQQFITLGQKRGDKSCIHYGILSDNKTVPVINNYIDVQNFTNTTCYDALLLPLSNTIVVDCAVKKTSPNSRGQIYQNIFYYFQISDGNKTKQLATEMYVPFESIYRRKLDIYQDNQKSHTFVLRTYLADKMVEATKDNTYVEVIMMENPSNPWVVGVIDRSFLNLPRLRIVDIKVYQGQIYILDQLQGVHRVYINGAEDLIYQNTYQAKGFTKLAVFSPNLDNRIELALANDHSVHQIDWTDVQEPRLINKYSLMPDSNVLQVFLNERFLFVRSTASDSQVTYSYTWVFTRGDRAFTKAFLTMSHGLSNTLIDVNEALSYILVVNDQAISNYYIDDPSFSLVFDQKEELMNVPRNFVLNTYSTDPNTPQVNITCSIVINFTLLDPNNRTLWQVGSAPPSKFTANYPGKVKLQLGDYVLGPNITYNIREIQKDTIKGKVFQNEQLEVIWQKSPPFTNITFLQTETISGTVSDTLMIYMQDNQNNTYISSCYPHHEKLLVHCNKTQVKDLGGKIKDWATTMVRNPYSQTVHHLLAYTTGKYYNTIFLRDLTDGSELDRLTLGSGFPGNISSLTITGKYMFAVLRHIKRINIYPLDQCLAENCFSICNINHMTMFKLGVKFFNPQVVHTSRFHPDILFIKTSDSIIAIDLSKECVPKLLNIIKPVENANTQFAFEVNSNFLVVTIAPNIVQEYDISRIYLKQVRKTKKYPLYGYKLPKNYDFDISDYGNCVYLSTITQGGDYNVFVYRSGLPAVGTLYNQIDLFAFQNLLIDASGYMIDYVTVITSNRELRIFRQYQKPQAVIQNADKDYDFFLEYHNSLDTVQLEKISVSIINLPTYIKVNPILKDIMNTKDYFYSGYNTLSEVNDTDWYKGNVLFIKAECEDCPAKIRVNNHIQQEQSSFLLQGLTAYAYTANGGDVLAESTLFKLKKNGSVSQIVEFPKNSLRHCSEVTLSRHRYSVIGCTQNNHVYLQVVSSIGKKSFAFQPQQVNANNILRLQATHNIVMLVDTDPDCYKKKRAGGIYLYEISDDMQSSSPLTEIEYIDGDDFNMKQLGVLNFNNAELIYNNENKIYRLYISEMERGLLIMEFTHNPGKGVVVKQLYFVSMKPMLNSLGETLPYDATFQAITLISTSTDSLVRRTTERLLITTGKYHTIQLVLVYDFYYFTLINKYIERFYLRYSYYEVGNEIKQNGGLFVVRQVIPDQYNNGNQTQQLYTVYSVTGPFNSTNVQKRGLIGALTLKENSVHRFDFNKTIDYDDQHSEPRIGLVVVEENGQVIKASLHRNLSLFTTQLVDTQIIYLDLINDFNLQKVRILLNGRSPYPEWKLITIIIFSILGGFLLIGVVFVLFKKLQGWKEMNHDQRQTLLSQQSTPNEYQ